MSRRGRPSKKEEREENVRREMEHIWESWDYHLREKLEGADRIIRYMVNEMSLAGSNRTKSITFIKPRFDEMIKRIALECEN